MDMKAGKVVDYGHGIHFFLKSIRLGSASPDSIITLTKTAPYAAHLIPLPMMMMMIK